MPNSSLPPSRGEVRWGVRRCEPAHQSRRAPIARAAPPTVIPALPLVIPAQAGTKAHPPLPQFIPPPSQGEARWGVRRHEPRANHAVPRSPAPLPQPPYPRSPLSFLRRQEPKRTHLFPNSSLPLLRGEARWGVRRCEPAHQSHRAPNRPHRSPNRHSCPPPYPRSPLSFLRRQEPKRTHLFPNSSLPPSQGGG